MAKEEILAGLKNAIDRGESLERAMKSFANAGYNTRDIQEAANQIQLGHIQNNNNNLNSPNNNINNSNNQSINSSNTNFQNNNSQQFNNNQKLNNTNNQQIPIKKKSFSEFFSNIKGKLFKKKPNIQENYNDSSETIKTKKPMIKIIILSLVFVVLLIILSFVLFGDSILKSMFG